MNEKQPVVVSNFQYEWTEDGDKIDVDDVDDEESISVVEDPPPPPGMLDVDRDVDEDKLELNNVVENNRLTAEEVEATNEPIEEDSENANQVEENDTLIDANIPGDEEGAVSKENVIDDENRKQAIEDA